MSQLEKIYGVHAVQALLQHHPKRVKQIWLSEGRSEPRLETLLALAAENRVPVGQAERREMDAWVEGVHQGVVAEVSPSQVWGELMLEELLERTETPPLILVLDGVTDPHNLGACLRVADGAGAHAVIAPKDHAVGVNATVAKVASGAAETVPYFMVTNLARTLNELKERNVWIVGLADEEGGTLYEVNLKQPVALVLGAEGPGLRQLTRKTCDQRVALPMAGAVESLNVSVASGVCLYEALRQRRAG